MKTELTRRWATVAALAATSIVHRRVDRADQPRSAQQHRQRGRKPGAATTLHRLAETLANDGITPEADGYFLRAIKTFEAVGATTDVAFVEMDRARAWSRSGEHGKAISIGEHALSLRLEIGDDACTAAAMDNLGLLYSAADDRTKAIALMERSLSLAEQVDDKEGMLVVLCNLAHEYVLSDREVNAIECYRRVLQLAEAADDRETLSMALDELGEIHSLLADDVPAAGFTRRALAMYERDQKDADVERLRRRLEQLERKGVGKS